MSKLKPTDSKTKEESNTYTQNATRSQIPQSSPPPSQAYKSNTEDDKELTEQLSNLTLVQATASLSSSSSSSTSSSSSSKSESKTTAVPSSQQQPQQVDSELADLLGDLSVSFEQAPFMPYCL